MSYKYTIELTRDEIYRICNSLNTEGKRFEHRAANARLSANNTTSKQTIDIWDNAATEHFALTHNIIRQKQNVDNYGPDHRLTHT